MLPYVAETLRTPRLTLRPFAVTDADDLFAYQSLPEVVRFLPWPVRDRAASAEHLATRMTYTRLETTDDALVLAIELDGTPGGSDAGRVIGDVNLFLRNSEAATAEIGWVLHPDFQGNGFAAEAASAVLDLAFGPLAMHRVFAHLDPRNSASAALCERLGMRREGHLREDYFAEGEWSDTLVYGMLAREWLRTSQS